MAGRNKSTLGLLALLLACAARVTAQTPVSRTPCRPERSETSACVWTGDCEQPGCANQCIANSVLTQSWFVLLDRSVGENFYSACPLLAYWVNRALSVTRGTGRRLLSQPEAVDIMKTTHMGQRAIESAVDRGRAASRSLLNLDGADSPSPSPGPGGVVSSDVPSNVCPTPADVDEARQGLAVFSSVMRQVFESDASGQPIPSDLEDRAYMLEAPNTYQWLASWLEDPDRVADYISNNCASETTENLQSLHYIYWLDLDQLEELDEDATMVQCVDNFGAFADFERNYQSVLLACSPPFGLNPDCFSSLGYYIVTSSGCATAYARMWNVTDATPLVSVAANVDSIQTACAAVTNEAECLSARTPVLDTIEELHNEIPILWPLDVSSVAPIGAIPPVGPVCFEGNICPESIGPPAPTPAPAPAPGPGPGPGPSNTFVFEDNELIGTNLTSAELRLAGSAVAAVAVLLPMLLM